MSKNNTQQTQIVARPEFDKLKIQLTKINETALAIQNRQIRIINTANLINSQLKSSIEDNIKDTNTIAQTEQRIKNLQERIDNGKNRLSNIREKFLKLKKLYKWQKEHKNTDENIFNLQSFINCLREKKIYILKNIHKNKKEKNKYRKT